MLAGQWLSASGRYLEPPTSQRIQQQETGTARYNTHTHTHTYTHTHIGPSNQVYAFRTIAIPRQRIAWILRRGHLLIDSNLIEYEDYIPSSHTLFAHLLNQEMFNFGSLFLIPMADQQHKTQPFKIIQTQKQDPCFIFEPLKTMSSNAIF